MKFPSSFDVVVIGGGHAGTEAALASARIGASTLLVTQSIETLGQMSCNPAIGGIGKSHLVREIDALGGAMALATDEAGIQFRMLNASKGPAVQALRAQADRSLYKAAIRRIVEGQPNLSIFQESVVDLDISGDRVRAVVCGNGVEISAQSVVLTTGTFLGGRIFIGRHSQSGGRAGDPASSLLAQKLRAMPFRVGRLKTGTPPRIDGRTVDFSDLQVQHGDESVPPMSFVGTKDMRPEQIPCHITYTNEDTHQIIREGLSDSPMFSGDIEGVGPRYCPSIEDKVVRFADRNKHQIFIEPEGLRTFELYPNGISTSLPFDVQVKVVHSIKGFEQAHITRAGYAIEYDFFDPRDLDPTLETRAVEGLYFAGQINGTTGYEEAAAQGLIAGINAARKVGGEPSWHPRRHEAYIGVMIDDLTSLGTNEPYRMFTSRAEYRLRLRQDNADMRLTATGRELGVVSDDRWTAYRSKQSGIADCKQLLQTTTARVDEANSLALERLTGERISREASLYDLLKRPEVDVAALQEAGWLRGVSTSNLEQAAIDIKYEGYIVRQETEIEQARVREKLKIPTALNYEGIDGLSNELKQKLEETRPRTMATASRIPGITPAALSLIAVHAKRERHRKDESEYLESATLSDEEYVEHRREVAEAKKGNFFTFEEVFGDVPDE